MPPPTLTPAEQIRRFIERHPGEWAQWSREGTRYPLAYAVLRLNNLPNICVTIGHEGTVVHTRTGGEAGELLPTLVKSPPGADLLTKIVFRVADSLQIHGGSVDTLPPWLAGPVSHQFINRARALLTSAGVSPADAVMAAETLDEALCQRAPVAATFSAVLATLQAIGMSCQWIHNPGDTGINPEREALQDARLALSCADDAMTREQLLDLAANLRRVLGVT